MSKAGSKNTLPRISSRFHAHVMLTCKILAVYTLRTNIVRLDMAVS
jgi:hypothetical protein